jgi:2-polyprenyl-3-methyl-5-hydroxy-6-metoxy-1,4-benzoquinol methylase
VGQYYQSEDYISHSNTKEGFINKAYHFVRKIMLSRKYNLIKNLYKGKDILDIGCGTGYFLDFMKRKQYLTLGVEADMKARAHGIKEFGLNILPPDDLFNGSIKNKFGIISLWHVLEHLYNPEKYMKAIRELLKDDGHLIIAVPNCSSYDAEVYKNYWAGYDVPRHLWHFTPETIDLFVKKLGFKIVELKRLPFDPFYVALLSEKYKESGLGFIKGGLIGLMSLVKSFFNVRKSSSIIYILKKTNN